MHIRRAASLQSCDVRAADEERDLDGIARKPVCGGRQG